MTEELSVNDKASAILTTLPSSRWRVFSRRFDAPLDELTSDAIVSLWIMCNEYERSINGGKDQWERWESMSLSDLTEYLGIGGEAEDTKSIEEQS